MTGAEVMSELGPMEYGAAGPITDIGSKTVALPPQSSVSILAGMKAPVLEGWACVYGKIHHFGGKLDVFGPGVFDHATTHKSKVGFWIDHDEDFVIDDTEGGLEIHSDDKGLGFRLSLKDNGVAEIVKRRQMTGVSVSYVPLETETFLIEGEQVRLIKRARLREISLVRRGAVKQAFATLIDAADRGSLASEMKSERFGAESSFNRLMQALTEVGT